MVTYAVTLSDLIEKGGAYAGLAAFFGFAVLSVLAFAQAREIRRLRDWAGRAPERAQELEQRVVQQAEQARRVVATPSRRPGEPATAAAQVAKPAAAAAVVAKPEAAEATPAATDAPTTAQPAVEGEPKPEAKPAAEPAVAAEQTAVEHPVVAEPAAETAATEEGEKEETEAVPAGATTALAPATPASTPANGNTGEAPPKLPPRATQGPPVTPRRPAPAPQPLRASQPPSRRPAPAAVADEPSSRRTPVIVAGIAAGLILIAIGLVAIFTGGNDNPKSAKTAQNAQTPQSSPASSATAKSGGSKKKTATPSRADTKVAVLNGTTVSGLAGQVDSSLTQAGYTESQTPTNYTDQARSASIVFYNGSANRTAAVEVGKLLDISDRQPIDNAASQLAPGADVVVVVGADQTP